MMKKRDLKSDFELLEAGFYPSGVELVGIAKHAIERAIKAEALARELVEALGTAIGWASHSQVTSLGGTKVSFRETSGSRIAEGALAKAKEVLGDEV